MVLFATYRRNFQPVRREDDSVMGIEKLQLEVRLLVIEEIHSLLTGTYRATHNAQFDPISRQCSSAALGVFRHARSETSPHDRRRARSTFPLELGKGFLFEARQKRFTFDEEHFFIDLVFYNRLLKYYVYYVLIDLKIGKLIHQDLGQMQMNVNTSIDSSNTITKTPQSVSFSARRRTLRSLKLPYPKMRISMRVNTSYIFIFRAKRTSAKIRGWIEEQTIIADPIRT